VAADRGPRLPPRPPAAAGPDRDPRDAERVHGRAGRGSAGGREHARGPADAVAGPGPEAVPRRVRVLVHGVRDRRRPGSQAGRPRARGVRAGRRRVLPDDGDRDRHRGGRAHQAEHRPGAKPRLRLHRRAVGAAGLAAVRHRLPLPQPADRAAGRRGAARRPGGQRGQPGRRRAEGQDRRGVRRRPAPVPGLGPDHRRLRRDRPARSGPGLRRLVGRSRRRGCRPGEHAKSPGHLRGGQAEPATVPVIRKG
jgi:hypothetical protein